MTDLETDIKGSFKCFENAPAFRKEGKEYILEGRLYCCVEGYRELDDVFNVAITIPFNFSTALPTVVEKDGKIPRTTECHMDAKGKCCLGTKIALFDYMHSKKINSFCQFLEQIVIIHFFQVNTF